MHEPAPGLREQKRLATERSLQLALLRIALERGSDAATVEEACREAGVSPRTFFNYFPSKEDALTGRAAHFDPSPEQVAAFLAGTGDVLTDLVRLVADGYGDEARDRAVHQLRRELLQREPKLVALRIASAHQAQQEAVALVRRRLRESGETRSELVVLLAMAAVRTGWMRWVGADEDRPLPDEIVAALADIRAVAAGEPALA